MGTSRSSNVATAAMTRDDERKSLLPARSKVYRLGETVPHSLSYERMDSEPFRDKSSKDLCKNADP
jgi:hypothetical protein